ncbi:MAG TPA: DUF2027 domain-containing protein, partial [Salinivirgaceae bacterium]|nr:DUF2027 domain-containing protein [Salinivirgaceae bacterium]
MEINIGDTVRYLNDVGGGKVVALLPDNRALVMDSSTGFEIPVPFKELVVVDRQKEPANKPDTKTSEVPNSTRLDRP